MLAIYAKALLARLFEVLSKDLVMNLKSLIESLAFGNIIYACLYIIVRGGHH